MDSLRLAKVAAVHPEGHSVDLVFLDDGSRIPSVQVMSPGASTNTGVNDLPTPSLPPSGDKWDLLESKDRDLVAVVAFMKRLPIVLGFLYPQVSQMLFAERDRRVERHASDVYTTVDADGNVELYHPSGTYLRIGTSPAHEDLTGRDLDKKWAIRKNTDKAVHVHLAVANAGVEVASLDVAPNGDVSLEHAGDLTTTTGGDAAAEVAGSVAVTAGGDLSLVAGGNITITAAGNVAVSGTRIDLN